MKVYGSNNPCDLIIQSKLTYVITFILIFFYLWNYEFQTILGCLFYTVLIFTFWGIFGYLVLLMPYFWENQRHLIYSSFKNNEIVEWILDSFMSPKKILCEFRQLTLNFELKVLLCRISVYFLAIVCYKLTLFLMTLYFLGMYLAALQHFSKYFTHPYCTQFFLFETLPFAVQQRFFELGSPSTRYRFTKAYPRIFMLLYYKNLHVDRLILALKFNMRSTLFETSQTFKSIYYQFKNIANGLSDIELLIDQNDWERLHGAVHLSVLNCLHVYHFPSNTIQQAFTTIDLSNLRNLEIWYTSMSFQDLMQLQNLNLQFILLWLNNDGMKYMKKAEEILEATVNVPELKFCYIDGIIKKADNFEIFLVEWVLANGYFKSFCCCAYYEEYGNKIKIFS